MSWDSNFGGQFSDSDELVMEEIEEIVDFTLPKPSPKKKKLITEFFKPTKRLPRSSGTPYFLQHYNPRPAPDLATGQSSTRSCVAGHNPAPNEISSAELYHEWYFIPPHAKL